LRCDCNRSLVSDTLWGTFYGQISPSKQTGKDFQVGR
jgi:hypothetical protein